MPGPDCERDLHEPRHTPQSRQSKFQARPGFPARPPLQYILRAIPALSYVARGREILT